MQMARCGLEEDRQILREHDVLVEDHGAAGDLPSLDVQPSQQVATLAHPEVDLVLEGLRYTRKFDRASYSLSTVVGSMRMLVSR